MKRLYGFKYPFILFFSKCIQLSCQQNLGFHRVERRLAHTRALFIQKESNQITEKDFFVFCFLWLLPACVVYDSETEVLQWDCVSEHAAFVLSFSIASVASFSRCVFSHCFPQPNRWLGERGSYSQAFKSLYLDPCAFKTKEKKTSWSWNTDWCSNQVVKQAVTIVYDDSLWRFVQAWCVWVFVGEQLTLMSSPNPKHAALICCKSGNSSNNNKKRHWLTSSTTSRRSRLSSAFVDSQHGALQPFKIRQSCCAQCFLAFSCMDAS